MLAHSSPIQRDLRYLALKCYLETRQIDRAESIVKADIVMKSSGGER